MTTAHVLIVEDNEANWDMLSRRLQRRGYRISLAHAGDAGVATATAQCPDLILMDISLPVIDGFEATRRLKAASATASIPIIALTAHAMASDRDRALAAGCDDFHPKPVDLSRLLTQMEALLGDGQNPPDPLPVS